MRYARFTIFGLLGLLLATSGVRAGDDGREDGRPAALAAAFRLVEARVQAELERARTLRQLGRHEEALEALEGLRVVYDAEIARLGSLVGGGLSPEAPPSADAPAPDEQIEEWESDGPVGRAFAGRGGGRDRRNGGQRLGWTRAVETGLRWLAAHQSPNGSWEAAGHGAWCDGRPMLSGTDGPGKPAYDVGVTGLALCAFLGAGYTNRGVHPFAKVVSKGLRYLKSVQDAEGCFGPRTTQHYVYNHAIASLAMVEAFGMTGSPIFRGPAQKALDFIALSRNPYFVWRYGVKPGDNDTSVTGWMMMALKSAQLILAEAASRGAPPPLVIDEAAFDGIRAWIDKMTDPATGRVGYIQRGGGPARPQEMLDRFPPEKSEAMTAVGVLARVLLGESPQSSALVQKGAERLAALPPVWNPDDGSIDLYYWYYGSLATFQVGGRAWREWSRAIGANLERQRRDGDPCLLEGSWDPVDPWGMDGGRVYSTALMTMTLEVHYRYARAFAAAN
jgi:hypothetical protein